MSDLSAADRIWNRACELIGRPGPEEGDTALSALLRAHNETMNNGLLHCVEVLSTKELAAAIDGYRYFGFNAVVDLIEKAREVSPDEAAQMEAKFDRDYWDLASDQQLLAQFKERFRTAPDQFGSPG